MTIEDKLNEVISTKQNIKLAIEEKGQNVGKIPFNQYPQKIRDISSGGIKDGIEYTTVLGTNNYGLYGSQIKTAKVYAGNDTVPSLLLNGKNLLTDLELSENIIIIGAGAFMGCNSLSNVVMSDKVIYIEQDAFSQNSELILSRLPSHLMKIGVAAFSNCGKITINEVPINVRKIEDRTFMYCTSLTELSMPGVQSIGNQSMYACGALSNLTIGSEGVPVSNISSTSFYFCEQEMVLNVYVEDTVNGIPGAPWGATNAVVNFLQA